MLIKESCPFCGAPSDKIIPNNVDSYSCTVCFAQGPIATAVIDRCRLWNTRPDALLTAAKAVLREYDRSTMFDANGTPFETLRALTASMQE